MKRYINFDVVDSMEGGGLYVGEVPDHLVEEFKREWNKWQLSSGHREEQKEIMFMANTVLPYVRSKWGTLHKHLINLPGMGRETVYPHILPII